MCPTYCLLSLGKAGWALCLGGGAWVGRPGVAGEEQVTGSKGWVWVLQQPDSILWGGGTHLSLIPAMGPQAPAVGTGGGGGGEDPAWFLWRGLLNTCHPGSLGPWAALGVSL